MPRDLSRLCVASALLLVLATPAAAFQAGDVYWAPGACDPAPPCPIFRVDAGAGSVTSFVSVGHAPGQFAWEPDGSALYLSQFDSGSILRITSGGVVSTWVSGIPGATGLLLTSGGQLLAVSYSDGAVYDVTDPSNVTIYASGFLTPRNLLERANGDILLVDQTARIVYRIDGPVTPFAWGFTFGIYDLVESGSGELFLSNRLGVYDVTDADPDDEYVGGGDFTGAALFASVDPSSWLVGLTIDPSGRLLASEIESGAVYDISAGGAITGAQLAATVPGGLGDTGLDTVTFDAPETPQVPVLGPLGYALLASLLLCSGARRR